VKLLNIARDAIFVSYMATCLQLLFLNSKWLSSTFEIRLQNVMINGVDLMVLGSHEGFSCFPKSLTLHNCCKHYHTYLVMWPAVTVCTLRVVCFALALFAAPPACGWCCGKPQGSPGGHGVPAPRRGWLRSWLQDTVLRGVRTEDGLQPTVKWKSQRWCVPSLPRVLCEELERVWAVASSLARRFVSGTASRPKDDKGGFRRTPSKKLLQTVRISSLARNSAETPCKLARTPRHPVSLLACLLPLSSLNVTASQRRPVSITQLDFVLNNSHCRSCKAGVCLCS